MNVARDVSEAEETKVEVVVCQKEALAKFANTSSSHSWWWQKVCLSLSLSLSMHMFANDALYSIHTLYFVSSLRQSWNLEENFFPFWDYFPEALLG